MKELLLQYAEYNVWANKLTTDALLQLDENLADKEVVSSFSSIRATTYHTIGAEYIWLQRLQLVEHPIWLPDSFEGTFAAACNAWNNYSNELVKFASRQYDDRALEHVCAYNDRKGSPHKTPVYQILQHIFNHSTYHRGQLITMLRQVGATKIPGTDFIAFVKQG